mmetsp:Transcript_62694/g.149578  ORF Transcript_62694/g.149578 Transcript_62694/m.149578 type:complete len:272 (-) Transcript_62694:7-822(-)
MRTQSGCRDVTAVFSGGSGVAAPTVTDLRYATEEVCADRHTVLRAVSKQGYMLKYAAAALQADKEVVLRALSQDGRALAYAAKELCGDREVIMKSVPQCGWTLQFASETLRGDREVVMAAVTEAGSALQHASHNLRGDRDIVMAAVAHTASALQYAEEPVVSDFDMLQAVAEQLAPRYFVLKVALLSGRACVLTSERWHKDTATRIAQKCAPLLDKDSHAVEGAQLLVDTDIVPDGIPVESWPGVETGKVSELTLVLPLVLALGAPCEESA